MRRERVKDKKGGKKEGDKQRTGKRGAKGGEEQKRGC